ncbi:hypothetical protein KR767_14770 [Luteibacter anthropi]|nr:hypothetical protein [Luteibacter anthropi]URX61328.1 hypothetical protein KR767_14770 [Luteibacter anthropi]
MAEARTMSDIDRLQISANISKLMAETMKISAETSKIQAEQKYYPAVAFGAIVVSALGVAAAIIVKLL